MTTEQIDILHNVCFKLELLTVKNKLNNIQRTVIYTQVKRIATVISMDLEQLKQ